VERAEAVINAHADEILRNMLDKDDEIIAVADLPTAPYRDALFINNNDNTKADRYDDSAALDEDSDADLGRDELDGKLGDEGLDNNNDVDDDNNDNENNADGVAEEWRLQRANRGQTTGYENYVLLLDAHRVARGGSRQAIIKDGFMFFLEDDLSDAKPVPVEDRLEYAFGVILQQYSIGASLKKFQEREETGVTTELSQIMHNIAVFDPIMKSYLTFDEKKKAISTPMLLKEKRDKTVMGRFCTDGRGLDEARDYVPYCL
jgi:hypothetical protein